VSKKKANHGDEPIMDLILAITSTSWDKDYRIRKKSNRKKYRAALKKLVTKGFIRTHAFINNWLLELFESGEISTLTFHDIIEKLPWSWDKTSEYFDSLEETGMVQYSWDSLGRKTCTLITDVKGRIRQVENMICFYKKYEDHFQMSFFDARKDCFNYHEKLTEWFSKSKELNKISTTVTPVPSSKMDKFIYNLVNLICRSKKEELESELLHFLKQKPLLIYSLERKC
jgi:hypothetical protein